MWFGWSSPRETSKKEHASIDEHLEKEGEVDGVPDAVDAHFTTLKDSIRQHRRNKAALRLLDPELSRKLSGRISEHGKRKMTEALEDLMETLGENDLTLPTCPVCKKLLMEEISTFESCQHGVCNRCMGKLSKKCPVCRTTSKAIKKLRLV
jgi:rubrerythrin